MSNRNVDDEQIITHLREGGAARQKAEDHLFNRFSYYIQEGMRKHSLTEDEAFDAYSDTILLAIRSITEGSFRGESGLNTYLHSIFRHKCVDNFRKRSSNKQKVHQTIAITDLLHGLPDKDKTVVEALMLKYDWELLRERLNQLGEKCTKLLLLTNDGYSTQEVQEALGFKSADVVKTSRLRCLDKLKQLYKAAN